MLVQTTPFNSFLWRVLIIREEDYKIGYISVFDEGKDIEFKSYDSALHLIDPIKNSYAVNRLNWFTKGFYNIKQVDDNIIMTDLRMGLEPDNYIFGFIVGKNENGTTTAIKNKRYSNPRNMRQLTPLWNRIWDEDVKF